MHLGGLELPLAFINRLGLSWWSWKHFFTVLRCSLTSQLIEDTLPTCIWCSCESKFINDNESWWSQTYLFLPGIGQHKLSSFELRGEDDHQCCNHVEGFWCVLQIVLMFKQSCIVVLPSLCSSCSEGQRENWRTDMLLMGLWASLQLIRRLVSYSMSFEETSLAI